MTINDANYNGKWAGYFKILKVYFSDDEIKDYYWERMSNTNEEYLHNPESDFIHKEEEELIQAAIKQLKEPYRKAYTLYSQDGVAIEDIAEIMKMKYEEIGRLMAEAEKTIILINIDSSSASFSRSLYSTIEPTTNHKGKANSSLMSKILLALSNNI